MLMPTDDPRTVSVSYFERKKQAGEQESFVDFAIQALVSPKTECRELEEMAALGPDRSRYFSPMAAIRPLSSRTTIMSCIASCSGSMTRSAPAAAGWWSRCCTR